MAKLGIRTHVLEYKRDTYLGAANPACNPDLTLIDCSLGSSQYGLSQKAIAAYERHNVLNDASYPDQSYDHALKSALVLRFNARVGLEQVFLGHGSFNLAERLIHKFLKPDTMLGVGPQFNEIPSEFIAAGGQYRPIPLEAPFDDFPMDALMREIRKNGTVVYLDNPNNPLGRVLSLGAIRSLARACDAAGAVLIVDEAYGDFVDDSESAINLVRTFRNLVVLRSFSKCLGLAAARVGYMFLSGELARIYRELDVPFEPTPLSAEMACATLADTSFIRRVRTHVARAKKRIVPLMCKKGFTVLKTHPRTPIFTVRRCEEDTLAAFASIGVAVEPGAAFRNTHPLWDNSFCRVRLPKDTDLPEFVHRLKRM